MGAPPVSPAQLLRLRLQRRADNLSPALQKALLAGYDELRAILPMSELQQIVERGGLLSGVLTDASIYAAFSAFHREVLASVRTSAIQALRDLPGKMRPPTFSFDYLNPRVLDAVRALDGKMMQALAEGVRDTVRARVEAGLVAGTNPRAIAGTLRSTLGLSPTQAGYVANLRTELESGKYSDAARRELIDRRYNLAKIDALPASARAARIDTIVGAYRKSWISTNAETVARTAALNAQREGQKMSWLDAESRGIVDTGRMTKTWRAVMDDRTRDSHAALNGETVGFDDVFSDGQDIPSEYNCRCILEYRVATEALTA
jgi:SPP1 gp7 family putative phage head morphogenesis protein